MKQISIPQRHNFQEFQHDFTHYFTPSIHPFSSGQKKSNHHSFLARRHHGFPTISLALSRPRFAPGCFNNRLAQLEKLAKTRAWELRFTGFTGIGNPILQAPWYGIQLYYQTLLAGCQISEPPGGFRYLHVIQVPEIYINCRSIFHTNGPSGNVNLPCCADHDERFLFAYCRDLE